MENELISVVVPIYNVDQYLKECVDSILTQTHDHIEIILVDDGSTDCSNTMCDEFAKVNSNIIVCHKKNGGLSSARNIGMMCSFGEILAFIDSDDFISPDMLSTLLSDMTENGADMACCNCTKIFEDGRIIDEKPKYDEITVLTNDNVLYGIYDDFSAWNKLYKKRLFQNIQYPEGKLYEDARTTYRLAKKCSTVTYNPSSLYFYRQRSSSIMGSFDFDRYIDRVNVWNEMISVMKQDITSQQLQEMMTRKNKLVIELLLSLIKSRYFHEHCQLIKKLCSEIEFQMLDKRLYSGRERTVLFLARGYKKLCKL